nr:transglutaminaseTgpA domain-containing protein [Lederbergia wuyishanensis]
MGFFLVWEWIRPLDQITHTGEIHYFVIFIAASLSLNILPVYTWFRQLLKTGLIIVFLYIVFGRGHTTFTEWIYVFFNDIYMNVKMLLSWNVDDLSDMFRTLLFFVLLWIMTYLLSYWLMIRKRIFIFYIMTILYVTVLDTFTVYNAEWAIVRIVGIGFALLGILFFQRLLEKEQIRNRSNLLSKWVIPLIVMIVASVFIGYASPKAGPIWPDPVPFIQSKAENVFPRQSGVSRIGYSPNDSKLGGPFLGDNRVVFIVKTPTKQYWKVETKDEYTGKGWEKIGEPGHGQFLSGDIYKLNPSDEPVRKARFDFKITYPHIVLPYGFLSVYGNEDGYFKFDSGEKLESFDADNNPTKLKQYEIDYVRTAFSLKEMRETHSTSDLDYVFTLRYTQVPKTLPDRVRDLAEEITKDHDNFYDKAKAIERYFKSGEFVYDQTDVAIPEEDQDYVDQFLFDTKIGYCDNFSTSMVVMLRSIGIPARWAKGYAAGQYYGETDGTDRVYKVTNNEAHSWVEVFFPTQGWVPFEPTIGFTSFATVLNDEKKDTTPITPAIQPSNPVDLEKKENLEKENNKQVKKDKTTRKSTAKVSSFIGESKYIIILIIFLAIVIVSWLYWQRSKWIPYVLLWKYKGKNSSDTLVHAYEELLKQLDRFGVKRNIGQTLREYANYVDFHFDTKDMSTLTQCYERAIYRGDTLESEWEYASELWENLIKKTTG